MRAQSNDAPACFMCASCCKREAIVARMQRVGMTLDVTGISGKPLYTRRGDRFCSDVSHLSRIAIVNASGDKALLLRR